MMSMTLTQESVFLMSRRKILKALGGSAVGVSTWSVLAPSASAMTALPESEARAVSSDDITPERTATEYNNYYEFGFSKFDPAKNAAHFSTRDWKVEVTGLVENPRVFTVSELTALFGEEERVYRMRCVEGWSMIIPWRGFSLAALIDLVKPTANARYVAFESCADPQQMPEVKNKRFPFPYLEGLRLDEARHRLTLLATGAYQKPLAPQSGAPIRLVVPWKYGFKSLKSIVKITLTEEEPTTTWHHYQPKEYGFYANVNPAAPHPRWSQASERVIGAEGLSRIKRKNTELFNGYNEVAALYQGMDLIKNY